MRETTSVFVTDRSQAVRLPQRFRFHCREVYIRRDEKTGDVVLSEKPDSWDSFFALDASTAVLKDFLSLADRRQGRHRPDPFKSRSHAPRSRRAFGLD